MQHRQQITDLSFLDEWMAKRHLRFDFVDVSPPAPLAAHIALLDKLREDSMSTTFGDADGCGDITEADTGVMSHAQENVGMVGQKVPAGQSRMCALVTSITRNGFHEQMIQCSCQLPAFGAPAISVPQRHGMGGQRSVPSRKAVRDDRRRSTTDAAAAGGDASATDAAAAARDAAFGDAAFGIAERAGAPLPALLGRGANRC
jgi:hypothetical protein